MVAVTMGDGRRYRARGPACVERLDGFSEAICTFLWIYVVGLVDFDPTQLDQGECERLDVPVQLDVFDGTFSEDVHLSRVRGQREQ
ncbi:hypothetical protein [Streptomyces sp. NPDC016734]|uniref:hypothetical protein n=1 Tax=Streptomyces TaxID=1883 RepID=UPI00200C2296|nr:hypothetical protein [Streptomyces virginiae]